MKRGLVITFIIIAIATSAGYYILDQENAKSEAKETAKEHVVEFLLAASTANPNATAYLSSDFPNSIELLQVLGMSEFLSLSPDQIEVELHTITTARASVPIGLKEGVVTIYADMELQRDSAGWKIYSFPEFVVIPVAIITEVNPMNILLLDNKGEEYAFHNEPIIEIGPDAVGKTGTMLGMANTLIDIDYFSTTTMNKILTVTPHALEGEIMGMVALSDEIVYFQDNEDGLQTIDADEIIVGMQNVILHYHNGLVVAATLPKEYVPEKIRVLLNTTDFTSITHNQVELTANSLFVLEDRVNQTSITFPAKQTLKMEAKGNTIEVTFPAGDQVQYENRLYLVPNNGRVLVESVKRGNPVFTPAYRGHVEIAAKDGKIILVNEVPLEEYLLSVVPSEMPISFGLEPLKVQSIAARSYAVASIMRGGWNSFSAHVDDSVSSQVYNNIPEYPESSQAAAATAGMIATYDGEIVDARFFSTSSGVTANFEEVWHDNATGDFPGTPKAYLFSKAQLRSGTLPDVTTENGAANFFSNNNWDAYDKASPWFRWEVEMSRDEIEGSLERYLGERYRAQSDFVLTYEDGEYISKEIPLNPLGNLLDLEIISRGGGGNIMELKIVGSNGTYLLRKEYTIRFTLRPVKTTGERDIILERNDGSKLSNYAILPSTFLTMTIQRDGENNIELIRFLGGGNGHGVGLSQWGARGLTDIGYSYEEILHHYYPGIIIEKVY